MRAASSSCFLPVLHATNAHSLLCKFFLKKIIKKKLLTLLKKNLQSSPEDLNGQQIAQSFLQLCVLVVGRKAREAQHRRPRPASLPGSSSMSPNPRPKHDASYPMHRSVPDVNNPDPDLRMTTPGLTLHVPNLRFPNLRLIRRVVVFTTIHQTSFGFYLGFGSSVECEQN